MVFFLRPRPFPSSSLPHFYFNFPPHPNLPPIPALDPSLPLEDFLSRVASEAGISGGASRVELLSGFPPAPLKSLPKGAEDRQGKTLASLGLSSGDALVARQGPPSDAELAAELAAADEAEAAARTAAAVAAAQAEESGGRGAAEAPGPSSSSHHEPSGAAADADWSSLMGGGAGGDQLDEDVALAAAIAASLQDSHGGGGGGGGAGSNGGASALPSFPKPAAAPAPAPRQRSNNDDPNFGDMRSLIASRATANDRNNAGSVNEGSVPTVSLRDGSAVARRVVDADNSCLFASVGYVMEGTRAAAPRLRALVAKAVASDPETYSEAFLGGEIEVVFF